MPLWCCLPYTQTEQDTMSDQNTIVAELAKTTENYAVYESAEVAGSQDLTGMYVSLAAFGENPEDFIEVVIGEDGPVSLTKGKDTKNYGTYESESGAISGMYVSHDVLGSEETEDGFVAPDERGISLDHASEEDFEESQEAGEEELVEEADSLLSGAGSEDAVEVEEDEPSEEEQEAEALLEEAEEAA